MKTTPFAVAAALLAGALLAGTAHAHGDAHHAKKPGTPISTERHPWGMEGDPKRATRTIKVSMADTMRFSPERIEVRRGETVRFEIANVGRQMHEFVIGTEAELVKHAEWMKKHPNMEHDEPYMAHVSPGRSGTITWRFTEPGTFLAGCLIAGHWEAGMKATIVVKP